MVALCSIGSAFFHGAWGIRLAGFAVLLACALLSPFSLTDARAACSTNIPATGDTVNCIGTDTAGVVNNAADNVTVTIESGATVTASPYTIDLNDNNRITNYGTITAADGNLGINVQDSNTIINIGRITVGDSSAYAIQAISDNTIVNRGTITVGNSSYGIYTTDRNTISNLNTLTIGNSSYGIVAQDGYLSATVNATITNSGTLTGGSSSTAIYALSNYNIVNSGTIELGDNGIGIRVDDAITVTNSGSIKVGAGGTGVNLNAFGGAGVNTFTNTGSVIAGAAGYGVFFDGNNAVVTNYGLIKATGDGSNAGYSLYMCNCTSNNKVTNYGTLDGAIQTLTPGGNHIIDNYGLVTISDSASSMPVGQFFNIRGTFSQFAGGVFAPRVDAAGTADQMLASNANLAGTLRAMIQPGLYGLSTTYSGVVFIYSGGTMSGTFDTVTTSSPFFTASANYVTGGANDQADLTITRSAFNAVSGMTDNQRAIGNALEPLYSTSLTGDAATFFSNLLAATSLGALDALSGEGLAQTQSAAFNANQMFGSTLLSQINSWLAGNPVGGALAFAQADAKPIPAAFKALERDQRLDGWRVWMAGFAGQNFAGGELPAGSADTHATTAGGAFGIDRQVAPDLLYGFAVGASSSKLACRIARPKSMCSADILPPMASKHGARSTPRRAPATRASKTPPSAPSAASAPRNSRTPVLPATWSADGRS